MLKNVLEITGYDTSGNPELEDILEIYKIDDMIIFYSKRYNEYTFENWYRIETETMRFKEIEFDFEIIKGLLNPPR